MPVAFAPTKTELKPEMLRLFWADVRGYLSSDDPAHYRPGELADENGHTDDLSLTKMTEDANDEETKSLEPASDENIEESVVLALVLDQLVDEVSERSTLHGEILNLLRKGCSRQEVLDTLGLKKSKGYKSIKAVQKLAKELYNKS